MTETTDYNRKVEKMKLNIMSEILRQKYGVEPGDIDLENRVHYWELGMTAEEAVDELAEKYALDSIR